MVNPRLKMSVAFLGLSLAITAAIALVGATIPETKVKAEPAVDRHVLNNTNPKLMIDLGSQYPQETSQVACRISNTSGKEIVLDKPSVSCACTTLSEDLQGRRLKPSESLDFHISVRWPTQLGPYSAYATIATLGEPSPLNHFAVTVSAAVEDLLAPNEETGATIRLGELSSQPDDKQATSVRIARGSHPQRWTMVTCDIRERSLVLLSQRTDDTFVELSLAVDHSKVAIGPFRGRAVFSFYDGATLVRTMTRPLVGRISGSLRVLPSQLYWGPIALKNPPVPQDIEFALSSPHTLTNYKVITADGREYGLDQQSALIVRVGPQGVGTVSLDQTAGLNRHSKGEFAALISGDLVLTLLSSDTSEHLTRDVRLPMFGAVVDE